MKIELKHLAPYLPYGLMVVNLSAKLEHGLNKVYLKSLGQEIIPLEEIQELTSLDNSLKIELMYKPLLRPLSDLTKEIEHNGEIFVPIDLMFIGNKKTNGRAVPQFLEEATRELSEGKRSPFSLQYWVIEKLFKWHFDVFGLIEQGLAIKK